ncbi:zinc finger protein 704-like [Brevipalpus obovatus]|uniref:zinc finger protein 704-like n=1 Tax=Brevipalpus obovatus TaxID=246614 RepID=UPI003D9E79AD
MDDCMAAMVLMSLSCSPKSSFISDDRGMYSVSCTSIDSGVAIGSVLSRTTTPSPPTLNGTEIIFRNTDTQSNKDEGIEMDETIDFVVDDATNSSSTSDMDKKMGTRIVFQCTWPGCVHRCDLCEDIERHVRIVHLGRTDHPTEEDNDHEEEFYYAEIEVADSEVDTSSKSSSCGSNYGPLSPGGYSSVESPNSTNQFTFSPLPASNIHNSSTVTAVFFGPSSAPTWSHLDMARPPHEDPEYKMKQEQQALLQQINAMNAERKSVISSPINIPGISLAHQRFSSKHRDHSMFAATPSIGASSSNGSCSTNNSSVGASLTSGHGSVIIGHHLSQASLLASSSSTSASSPSDLSSPRTSSSKVMRLSNTSSPSGKRLSSSHHHHHHHHHQWTSLLHQGSKATISPSRRSRTETRKCRKVYGMENRDSWCTQCKWKKACTRFVD